MLHRVQVAHTSQHQLFRGDCVNQVFMFIIYLYNELLQRSHFWGRTTRRRECHGPRNTKNGHSWKSVLLSYESKFEIFGSSRHVFVSREKVSRWFLHVWFPQWSMEEKVWWYGGAWLVTLLGIYSKFKAHLTNMATTAFCSDMPSHLVCRKWEHHLFFKRQWPQTHLQAM